MGEKQLYRDKIKQLLIIYSLSFIVISVILVYAFISIYTNYNVRNSNNKSNEIIREILSDELKTYVDFINEIENESFLHKSFSDRNNQSQIYEQLYDFINARKIKSVFYLVNTDGKTILTNNYVNSPYDNYEIFLSGLFKQLNTKPDEIIFMNNKVQIDITKRTVYSVGKSIKADGEIVGYLIFDILESDLNRVIHKTNIDILVITDHYNNVILSTNSLLLDEIGKFKLAKNAKNAKNKIRFMDKEYYFYKSELLDNQIQIYSLSRLDMINSLLTMSLIYFSVVMVVIAFAIIRTADYSAKKKTQSINQLITSINKAQEGDLSAFVSINSNDEFQVIGEQFNKMLAELDVQIKRNSELIDRNRMAVIKQLESQFNPHFIFNTLETLKYMIKIDANKASDIIINFAKILRYSIDYEDKNIVLEQDIKYLNSYLLIQKYRYNQRLTYKITIDDNLKDCIVPKLIMQPIIENCINHGYYTKETLFISLNIIAVDNDLVMNIEDDGDGITKSRIKDINNQLNSEDIVSNSIGLNNVHRRLKLLYGEGYGLTLNSIKGERTIVKIKMPIKKW